MQIVCGTPAGGESPRILPAVSAWALYGCAAACRQRSSAISSAANSGPWRCCTPIWPPSFAAWGTGWNTAKIACRAGADLYVFNPSLMTLDLERRAMAAAVGRGAAAARAGRRRAGPASARGVCRPRRDGCARRGGAVALELDEVLASESERCDVGVGRRSRRAAAARLVALWARPVPASARFLAISHGADPIQPRLPLRVRLLPVHCRRAHACGFASRRRWPTKSGG